jgi:hypothetical protein
MKRLAAKRNRRKASKENNEKWRKRNGIIRRKAAGSKTIGVMAKHKSKACIWLKEISAKRRHGGWREE